MTKAISHQDSNSTLRPIELWVEDSLSKEYYQKIWEPDNSFQFRIAGSVSGVEAVVRDLHENGQANVFGIVDRDFRETNRPRWGNREINVFRPSASEIENYLLNWEAIVASLFNARLQRTPGQIETIGKNFARIILWWLACRQIIFDFHDVVLKDFPNHPNISVVSDLQAAKNFITASPWFQTIANRATDVVDIPRLETRLNDAHRRCQAEISDNSWLKSFPGKEIFRHIRGNLTNPPGTPAELDTDLAKFIAGWQVTHDAVPAELLELRDTIKQRCGIQASPRPTGSLPVGDAN